ncbi:MAG: peptidoglycan-binding protein, partial [Defluviitaleaceae bacterium]|nr:peptidoglycan-binding protein [Defluviitaleaceae bacterium]
SVRLIQQTINRIVPCRRGQLWTITVDGNFGTETRDAIFTFQNIFGMPITGVVDRATWDRIMQEADVCGGGGETPPPPPPTTPTFPGTPIRMGDSGENVGVIQQSINRIVPCRRGQLWTLTVDGNFGAMTRDAIFTFQNIFGMPITGVVDRATWDRIMQEADACGGSVAATILEENLVDGDVKTIGQAPVINDPNQTSPLLGALLFSQFGSKGFF